MTMQMGGAGDAPAKRTARARPSCMSAFRPVARTHTAWHRQSGAGDRANPGP